MNQAIPLETQTLYAELLERFRVLELERTFGHLAGGFGRKVVKGKTFWYFRTSEGGHGRSEFYVGPKASRGFADDRFTTRPLHTDSHPTIPGGCAPHALPGLPS